MDRLLQRGDLINGRHGKAVAMTDNGQRETMFYLKKINVPAEVESSVIKRLGTTTNINFLGSPNQNWDATLYRSTRFFRNIMVDYLNTGKETRFDLILVQDDPNHEGGAETVILKGCLLKTSSLINLDIDSDTAIEESISGTFDGVEVRA